MINETKMEITVRKPLDFVSMVRAKIIFSVSWYSASVLSSAAEFLKPLFNKVIEFSLILESVFVINSVI